MSVRILYSADDDYATLYCSTSMWSFGPIFCGDAQKQAEAFLRWLCDDARSYSESELENKVTEFLGHWERMHENPTW